MKVQVAVLALFIVAVGCGRRDEAHVPPADPGQPAGNASSASPRTGTDRPAASAEAPAADGPRLASTVIAATIYKLPDTASRRLGYVRLGGTVRRDAEPVEGKGCKHEFYHVYPMGYVCTD